MKKLVTGIVTFFLPSRLIRPLLRIMGHKIGKKVKIGFSFLYVRDIELEEKTNIGHFNLFIIDKIAFSNESSIGYLNILKGPFSVILKNRSALGNKNYISRAKKGVTYGKSVLSLGKLTKVTTGHHLDLTRSIIIGDNSIIAGINSQLWTHGYYHANKGPERIRIDGDIYIGNNVYVGTACIFNPGVKVLDGIHLGAGSVVSKNLEIPGMYVSQGLRHIENDIEKVKSKLNRVTECNMVEPVYKKN